LKALNLHTTQHPDDAPRGTLDGSLWTTANDPFKKGKISKQNYDDLKSRVDNHARNAENPRIRNRFQRISTNMDRLEQEHHAEVRSSTGFFGMGKKKLPTHLKGTTAPVNTTPDTLASFPPLDSSIPSSTTQGRPPPAIASSSLASTRSTGELPPPRDDNDAPMTQIPALTSRGITTSSIQGHGVSGIHDDSEGTLRALRHSTDPSFDVVPSTNPYTGPRPDDTGTIGPGAATLARDSSLLTGTLPTSSSGGPRDVSRTPGVDDDSIADLDISATSDVPLSGPIVPGAAVSARDSSLLTGTLPTSSSGGPRDVSRSSGLTSTTDGTSPRSSVSPSSSLGSPTTSASTRPPAPASDETSASGTDQVITINITAPPGTIANLGGNAQLDRNNLAQVDVTLAQLVQSIA
jgi:hypothetical protein